MYETWPNKLGVTSAENMSPQSGAQKSGEIIIGALPSLLTNSIFAVLGKKHLIAVRSNHDLFSEGMTIIASAKSVKKSCLNKFVIVTRPVASLPSITNTRR